MNWTPEQQKVIEGRNGDMIVSAAAGSGKTTVLSHRIVGMIMDPDTRLSLDRLLVMTFTRAAADEMRQSIGKALDRELEADPDNSALRLQKALLPRAMISTIDSVCQTLVRQYYQNLEIDPGFRVGDTGELKLLKAQSMEELLEERFEAAEEAFLHFSLAYGGNGLGDGISGMIEKTAEYVLADPWPEDYLERELERCKAEMTGCPEATEWFDMFRQDLEVLLSDCGKRLEQAAQLTLLPEGPAAYLKDIKELQTFIENFPKGSYGEMYGYAQQFEPSRLSSISKKSACDEDLKEQVRNTIDLVKKTVLKKELQTEYFAEEPPVMEKAVAGAARAASVLIGLVGDYLRIFQEKKRERNLIDFSDMEHLALELLYRKTETGERVFSELADQLAGTLDEIMIDEYQDSNPAQEALIRALSGERFGRPDIFTVGDVKQSIYSFRQARPGLFIRRLKASGQDEGHKRIELNRNFRSRREVVDAVNDIFDCIMHASLGDVEYDAAARLNPGAVYPDSTGTEAELLIFDAADAEEGKLNIKEKTLYEYRMIASRIRELSGQGAGKEPFMVTDRDTGCLRPLRYGDVAVLMRSPKGRAEDLVDVLNEAGIPAHFETSTGYFSASEVETMLAFLNVIDNPRQDIALAAVLKSPVGGFTDEELAQLRIRDSGEGEDSKVPGGFYSALRADGENPEGMEKSRAFLAMLDRFRQLADALPVSMLIRRIYSETGFYTAVSAMPMGAVRRKNLDMLVRRAENYGATGSTGLFEFTRYVEMLKEYSTDYGEAGLSGGEDDMVKIMSIHHSKGLEYPVVIYAGLSAGFNTTDTSDRMVMDPELGISMDLIEMEEGIRYPSLKKRVLAAGKKRDMLGEELRIMYVAMTRAREKLILTASVDDMAALMEKTRQLPRNEPADRMELMQGANRLRWIMMSTAPGKSLKLMVRRQGDLNTEKVLEEAGGRLAFDDMREQMYSLSRGAAGTEKIKQIERLCGILSAEYPYQAAVHLRPKLSVSEIAHPKDTAAAQLYKLPGVQAVLTDADVNVVWPDVQEAGQQGPAISADQDKNAVSAAFSEPTGQQGPAESADQDGQAVSDVLTAPEQMVPEEPEYSGAGRGTLFHKVLEKIDYRQGERSADAGTIIGRLKAEGVLSEEEAATLDSEGVEAFLCSDLARRMAEADIDGRLFREQHFMFSVPALDPAAAAIGETQIVQGIIDAFFIEKDGSVVLVDYKTDRLKDPVLLAKRHEKQLELYASALERITRRPVREKIIFSTCIGREIGLL